MPVIHVEVATPSGAYLVHIGEGLISNAGDLVRRAIGSRKVALITDENVAPRFAESVTGSLAVAGFDTHRITVPAGERSKSWELAGQLLEDMASAGLDRRDAVVALGGGVVGDLAGFCAATYMRGIDFVQIPTTLLAQVDSSVGGKTAVDLRAGKNLAGAFMQPSVVLADTEVLLSLPESEWLSGLGEVAKSAVLDGEESLSWTESVADALVSRDPDSVREAVRMCVTFKAGVVAGDERETGLRESLNLGHTLGHAIEKVLGYGNITHGAAVADGMRFAARLAAAGGFSDAKFSDRQDALLDSLGLHRSPEVYDIGDIRTAMSSDKKARGGRPRFVFAVEPGSFVVTHVEDALLMRELEMWVASSEEEMIES